MSSSLKVSLRTNQQDVEMETLEGTRKYVLREMTALNRDVYMDSVRGVSETYPDGTLKRITSINGMQSGLVCKCLYDDKGQLVSEAEVQGWPASVVSALFEAAQKLNGLHKGAIDDAKKV